MVDLMIQMNSIDLWMTKMTHYMNSLMPLMFDVMCNLLVMMCGCCKPPRYVPYKCTFVPYDGTFGTSDQGQMLDV